MCQLVAEFSSFANSEEKKRTSNVLMSFPKLGNQMSSFGQIRQKNRYAASVGRFSISSDLRSENVHPISSKYSYREKQENSFRHVLPVQ